MPRRECHHTRRDCLARRHNIAALTRVPSKARGPRLVHAARAMATAAAAHVGTLTAGGMPPDTADNLADATNALQTALTDRASSRVNRITATKAIEEQLRAGREAVNILHAIVSRQFANDSTMLVSWSAARRVSLKVGAVRGSAGDMEVPVAPPTSTHTTG